MKKRIFISFLFVFFPFILIFCQDKVCNESIALETIENTLDEINEYNEQIKGILKRIIIKSENSSFITRENLGDLAAFYEGEENIRLAFMEMPSEKLKLFISKDINYIGFINTKKISLGQLDGALSTIEFFNTYKGNPTIILNIQFTIDEASSEQIMYKRIKEQFSLIVSCNEIDNRISNLQKKLIKEEDKMTDFIKSQSNACAGLEMAYENYNKRKKKKLDKNYESLVAYLETQKIICNNLKPIIENIDIIKRGLRDAENEKIEFEKKNVPSIPYKVKEYEETPTTVIVEEYKPTKVIKPVKVKDFTSPKSTKPKKINGRITPITPIFGDYKIGKELNSECLDKPLFITTKKAFDEKFNHYSYVQFASLPLALEGYKPCEFQAFFKVGAPAIYLIDKGKGKEETRRISLIGPFKNKKDANQALGIINQFQGYKDAFIYH